MRSKARWLANPRMAAAVEELRALISARYPGTAYELAAGDDPEGLYLTAIVDVDDPDEVVELIVDRLLRLQIEEQLPLYVIPVRTAQRRDRLFGSPAERLAETRA